MTYEDGEAFARGLDAADALGRFRSEFLFPAGAPLYFAGHSLGLQPRRAREYVSAELEAWARHAVEGHFAGPHPWLPYHELVTGPVARLCGALPHEVVTMNTLTVNLHLLLISFYRPAPGRYRIVTEPRPFPSDRYALESQARLHGYSDAVVEAEDPAAAIGPDTALALVGQPSYFTGAAIDVPALIAAAQRHGCPVGLDLAHGIGNLRLSLHDWDVDFAVWCNYKYLNAGPGGLGGAFVHERHARADLLRLAGWWGHDKSTRFQMGPAFQPLPGAEGWQLSNPPILPLAALRASLELFDAAGIAALRAKSVELTAYLEWLLLQVPGIEPLTPRDPERRGSMLTVRVRDGAEALVDRLRARGALCDFRAPDVVRLTPAPLYVGFDDVRRLAALIREERARG